MTFEIVKIKTFVHFLNYIHAYENMLLDIEFIIYI